MKIKYISLIITLIVAKISLAKPGCMDTSNHNRGSFDTKTEHYVLCYCPCKEIIQQQNMCLECGHIHYPQEWHIVGDEIPEVPKKPAYSQEVYSVEELLQKMIDLYSKKKL